MKLSELEAMSHSDRVIWVMYNPQEAAVLLEKTITEINHLKEMLTPTRIEEPGWPSDCVMHDCHECRCTSEECSG